VSAPDPRDALLRALVERVRGRLGSLRAAVETLDAFPDMPAEARAQFQAVLRDETAALADDLASAEADHRRLAGPRPASAAADVLAAVADAVTAATGALVAVGTPPALVVGAAPFDVGALLGALAARLPPPPAFWLSCESTGALVGLDLGWAGRAPAADRLAAWLRAAPMPDGSDAASWLAAHDAAVVAEPDGAGGARLRLLLAAGA